MKLNFSIKKCIFFTNNCIRSIQAQKFQPKSLVLANSRICVHFVCNSKLCMGLGLEAIKIYKLFPTILIKEHLWFSVCMSDRYGSTLYPKLCSHLLQFRSQVLLKRIQGNNSSCELLKTKRFYCKVISDTGDFVATPHI